MHDKFDERECYPVVLIKEGVDMADAQKLKAAIAQVWPTLTLDEKIHWHDVCCNNSRNSAAMASCQRITDRIKRAAARKP